MKTGTVTQIVWGPPTPHRKNGPWHINGADFVGDDSKIGTSSLVEFGPHSWAANHKHGEVEILACLSGELFLAWRDDAGVRHEVAMTASNEGLTVFVIDPFVPHFIENRSDHFVTLQVWSGVSDGEPVELTGEESLATNG